MDRLNISILIFPVFLFTGEQSEKWMPSVREALSPKTDQVG